MTSTTSTIDRETGGASTDLGLSRAISQVYEAIEGSRARYEDPSVCEKP